MAASEAPEQLPAVLNNFGIACTFLAEPDEAGIPAMKSALLMKRAAGMSIGGTLQNLTNLLMRFGHFSEALPLASEQAAVAREKGDHRLELDAQAKVAAMHQFLQTRGTAEPIPLPSEQGGADEHQRSMERLVQEGRIRSALLRRWPLLRDVIEVDRDMQTDMTVCVKGTTFLASKAQTILLLSRGELRLPAVESPLASEGDENFILELVDEPLLEEEASPEKRTDTLAGIWWVRTGSSCWVQAFWNQRNPDKKGGGGIAFLRGSLFAVDPGTGKWAQAPHADACDCGRPEVHAEIRDLAESLLAAYGETRETPQLRTIWKKRCAAVFVEGIPRDHRDSPQPERNGGSIVGNGAST